jgi:hypothetical protein
MLRTLVAGSLLLLLTAGAAAGSIACESPSGWQLLDRVDPPASGYLLYKCRPSGSDYDAYRLEAEINAPAAMVASAARANMADPAAAPARATKKVVRDEGNALVVYMIADLPLVADRDVVTRGHGSFDAKSGVHRLEWQATDEEGPAPKDGVVRIKKSDGSWTFTPLDRERTRAIYESHSELGGSVPAWIVNSLMTEAVVDNAARLRARVERVRHKESN